jgi:hypothetical protein
MQLRSFSLAACASFLLALVALMPSRALADSITITQNLATMVVEGKGGSLTYAVTNTGGGAVKLSGLGFGPIRPQGPDFTDKPISAVLAGTCDIGTILAPGATCTVIFKFKTAFDEVENVDHGTSLVKILVGTAGGAAATTVGTIDVGDCGFNSKASCTVTPEPSSLLLLGTGLVGLVPVLRRKLRM